jgi:phosphinothricin acetyltransferase
LDTHVDTESGAAVIVREMAAEDWPDAARIYAEGIATRDATFETTAPAWADWDAAHTREHRWVATIDGAVAGWVACSPVSTRCVYAGVLELSVYVAAAARGRGVGSALLAALVTSTEAAGVWTLETGIFPENTASLALHVKHGFRVVGTRERIGQMDGVWRDTVLLERRSTVVR